MSQCGALFQSTRPRTARYPSRLNGSNLWAFGMETSRLAAALLAGVVTGASLLAQAPASPTLGPTFDVVSIRRNTQTGPFSRPLNPSIRMRPDGGITMTSMPVGAIINRAYPSASPRPLVGLPGWATSERYDVAATSTLPSATAEQHQAMLRAMLADRFQLQTHTERRTEDAFDLVLARADGRLGSGMTKIDADCDALMAARAAALEAARDSGEPPPRPDLAAPPDSCTVRMIGTPPRGSNGIRGNVLEGETTMTYLAQMLRLPAGRIVVDKTGLTGSYRVSMTFDMMALRQPPSVEPSPDAPPSVLTALPEQLGLKLQPSRAEGEVLVVDRIERPSEN